MYRTYEQVSTDLAGLFCGVKPASQHPPALDHGDHVHQKALPVVSSAISFLGLPAMTKMRNLL